MPFALLIWGIAIGVGALLGGAVVVAVLQGAKDKTLVLIGPKVAGKTTWRTFLENGTIPKGYEHTTLTEKVKAEYKLRDLNLRVKIEDLSGSDDAVNEWRKAARYGDHVFYFVDVSRLADEKYKRMVRQYARLIASWEDVKAPVSLVASHADLMAGWPGESDDIRTREDVAELRQLSGATRTLLAGLGSIDGCRDFTLTALANLGK